MAFKSKLQSLAPRRTQFQKKVKLLSGGYTSPTAFPGGEITVYPWDTNIDDWLADRLKKGNQATVMYDTCAKLCDLNGCPINNFVIGDVNTVLLVARSIRFDSVVQYSAICPACGYEEQATIVVPDELGRIGEKEPDYPGYDEITLPNCQDVVRIRPLLVKDEKQIAERDDSSKALMTDHVMRILLPIVSINDGKPDAWEDALLWFNALSPLDAVELEAKETQLYPHLDTDIPHQCDRCRNQYLHSLDFSKEFFRGGLKPGKGVKVPVVVRPGSEQQKPGVGPQ